MSTRENVMMRDQLIEWFMGRMMPDQCDPEEFMSFELLKGKSGEVVRTPNGVPVYVGTKTFREHYRKLATEEVSALMEYIDMHGIAFGPKPA